MDAGRLRLHSVIAFAAPLSDNRSLMPKVLIANLETGMPTATEALLRLEFELRRARSHHAVALKVIHGYGSHGVGGVLREVIQDELRRCVRNGSIRAFVPGEDWRISNEVAWEIQKQAPELKRDRDLGRGNKGISVVLL